MHSHFYPETQTLLILLNPHSNNRQPTENVSTEQVNTMLYEPRCLFLMSDNHTDGDFLLSCGAHNFTENLLTVYAKENLKDEEEAGKSTSVSISPHHGWYGQCLHSTSVPDLVLHTPVPVVTTVPPGHRPRQHSTSSSSSSSSMERGLVTSSLLVLATRTVTAAAMTWADIIPALQPYKVTSKLQSS